jgi:tRNA(Ile)-lysidine synthase TilS/MesJ
MKAQKLYTYTRKAIDDYHMIQPKDKIAIGISGGKDSLTLLYAMAKLKEFYPIPYDIVAITVELGFENFDTALLSQYAESLHVPYYVEKTEIAKIVFDLKQEPNPCSLCSRLRKGAFNEATQRLGCNKIAYAHHKDDVINSFLMSLLYEGRIHTFSPVTHLEKSNLYLIRPLIYAYEGEILSFAMEHSLPVKKNPCPEDGVTKRQEAKELIQVLKQTVPATKERIFSAIRGSGIDGW